MMNKGIEIKDLFSILFTQRLQKTHLGKILHFLIIKLSVSNNLEFKISFLK